VLDHVGKRFAGFHIFGEREKCRAGRVGEPAVRDHHVRNRLRWDLRPDSDRLEQSPDRRDNGGRATVCRFTPECRIGDSERKENTKALAQYDPQGEADNARTCDEHIHLPGIVMNRGHARLLNTRTIPLSFVHIPGRCPFSLTGTRFMPSAVQDLLATLDLERLEVNLFRGRSPQVGWQRVFGGQVIGQALVAACRTVDVAGRPPHSLHAYFLLGGHPKVPIIYEVDRIRDGKSFTTRRVVAIQHGQAIFTLMVSLHIAEPGLAHQAPMPQVPPPEELPSEAEIRAKVLPNMPEAVQRYYKSERPLELRPVEFERYLGKKIDNARFHVWIRTTVSLPDDPAIHQCVLAYASDLTLLDVALVPHGRSVFDRRIIAASLDHGLWFHRPFRADQWLLYAQDSPNLSGARGFSRGLIFTRDGTLVASVAQEGLLRERARP